jgi:hypothetical protein
MLLIEARIGPCVADCKVHGGAVLARRGDRDWCAHRPRFCSVQSVVAANVCPVFRRLGWCSLRGVAVWGCLSGGLKANVCLCSGVWVVRAAWCGHPGRVSGRAQSNLHVVNFLNGERWLRVESRVTHRTKKVPIVNWQWFGAARIDHAAVDLKGEVVGGRVAIS